MPELTLFSPETASHAYLESRNDYLNAMRREEMPDDPPTSLEFSINNARGWALVKSAEIEAWHLWDTGDMMAELFLIANHDENNPHLMSVDLRVLKPYRRRGYAKLLLARAVAFAEKHERTLVNFQTNASIPAGEEVAAHLGATRGLELGMNQLILSELDRTLLSRWLELAKTKARDFELGFWGKRYPEGEIDAIIELLKVMNSAPRDALQEEDGTVTPEELREMEAYNLARGVERWVLYARHKSSGKLAGFTETHWYPENPENLEQITTGVIAKYRGNGLGRWLKAAMIQKVLAERPAVKRIRTENAHSNAPMLAINKALGFKPYKSEIVWQLEIARLKNYLGQQS